MMGGVEMPHFSPWAGGAQMRKEVFGMQADM
jgi:hypothetical protein